MGVAKGITNAGGLEEGGSAVGSHAEGLVGYHCEKGAWVFLGAVLLLRWICRGVI